MNKAQNKRFMLCVHDIILKEKVKDRIDLVSKMKKSKLSESRLSLISKYKKSFTIPQLTQLCELFGVSANYVLLNQGPKYLAASKGDRMAELEDRIAALERN